MTLIFRTPRMMAFGLACAMAVAFTAACSSSHSAGPVAQKDFPAAYAHAVCDNVKGCCGQAGYAYDANACFTQVQSMIAPVASPPGAVSYDANAAGTCIEKLGQAIAQCGALAKEVDPSCNAIFKGTFKPGEPCTASSECAAPQGGSALCSSWVISDPANPSSGSACFAVRSAQVGDACLPMSTGPFLLGDCTDPKGPMYCDYATNRCRRRSTAGQSCTLNECTDNDACVNSVCTLRLSAGEPCLGTGDQCITGYYCGATHTCVPPKKPGEACDILNYGECGVGVCLNGKCSAGAFATPATCAGVPAPTGLDAGIGDGG